VGALRHRPGNTRVLTVAVYNLKGGVGKTSAAVNLAFLAARDGYRTLLWDIDPQGGATYLLRGRPKVKGGARALINKAGQLERGIRGTEFDNLDLLPADRSYRAMDLVLDRTSHSTRRLGDQLRPLEGRYDLVVLDCPPSASLASQAALRAASLVLIPVIPATLSWRTLDQVMGLVQELKPPRPALLPFLSLVDRRRRLHREVAEELRAGLPSLARAAIPISSAVEQMGPRRSPVHTFAGGSSAALAYQELWAEVRELAAPGPGGSSESTRAESAAASRRSGARRSHPGA
jgi:chromosome partitioning protein